MNSALFSAARKYLHENGFTKEAEDPNYICKFILSLKNQEKFKDRYEYALLKHAEDPSWSDIALTGLASALPGAALGYLTSSEMEDPINKALQYGAITGIAGSGLKAGVPKKLYETYGEFSPQSKSILKGMAIGAIPSGALGYLSANEEESPWHKALHYGTVGTGLGAVGGLAWDRFIGEEARKSEIKNIIDKEKSKNTKTINEQQYNSIVSKNDKLNKHDSADIIKYSNTLMKQYGKDPFTYQEQYGRDFVSDIKTFENIVSSVEGSNKPYYRDSQAFDIFLTPNVTDPTGKVLSTGVDLLRDYLNNPSISHLKKGLDITNFNKSTLGYFKGVFVSDYGTPDLTDKNFNLFINKIKSVDNEKYKKIIESPNPIEFFRNTKNIIGESKDGYALNLGDIHERITFNPYFLYNFNNQNNKIDDIFIKYVKSL